MDFGFYYRPDVNRVLFHFRPDDPAASPCCYDTVVSESRIVDYIGIGRGQLPQKEYFGRWRTFPDTCDWSWQETKPIGSWRRYFGVDVFEGAYVYNGIAARALVGRLDVRGADAGAVRARGDAGRRTAGATNHPRTVQAQIFHGMTEAGYGYWGFSPANKPEGDYGAWGVDGAAWTRTACPRTRTTRWSITASPAAPTAPPSPTRRRPRTRTASSRRTRRSSALRYAPKRDGRERAPARRTTSPASTASGASATA